HELSLRPPLSRAVEAGRNRGPAISGTLPGLARAGPGSGLGRRIGTPCPAGPWRPSRSRRPRPRRPTVHEPGRDGPPAGNASWATAERSGNRPRHPIGGPDVPAGLWPHPPGGHAERAGAHQAVVLRTKGGGACCPYLLLLDDVLLERQHERGE